MSKGAYFALDSDNMMVLAPGNILITNKNVPICDFLVSSICYFALKKFYMGGGIEGELKVNRLLLLPIPLKIDNKKYSNDNIANIYGLTSEEMNYINFSI